MEFLYPQWAYENHFLKLCSNDKICIILTGNLNLDLLDQDGGQGKENLKKIGCNEKHFCYRVISRMVTALKFSRQRPPWDVNCYSMLCRPEFVHWC
jgi:hypothetical protein